MKRLLLALAFSGLGACASLGGSGPDPVEPKQSGDGSFSLTALDEAALPPGKCGMILWTLDAQAPAPVLRYVAGEAAEIEIDGAPVKLSLDDSAGGGEFGVSEQQSFAGEAGYEASVDVHFGLGFDGGVYLERGVITVRAANGWEVVAPTAGIAGCRRK